MSRANDVFCKPLSDKVRLLKLASWHQYREDRPFLPWRSLLDVMRNFIQSNSPAVPVSLQYPCKNNRQNGDCIKGESQGILPP